MRFGFDECRACGKWIWRGDGEELCAPCLVFFCDRINEKQRRRHLFIIACVLIGAAVLLVLHLSGKPVGAWFFVWLFFFLCVRELIAYDDSRRKPTPTAERGDSESRDDTHA